eukprot:CAMPEP_0195513326 /NCGR_PEP_ID=MMETSP0794_2-20130614/5009_1 /TAXON_ID=515487 /ORGANISM="Stephanopyxis turris, Strain CCMP 815" /LENGTH=121 /DNA_ID=CAMNT_0040641315 /DNA_START=88 /DNA_END=453 /DNA_ORIENTATION=-
MTLAAAKDPRISSVGQKPSSLETEDKMNIVKKEGGRLRRRETECFDFHGWHDADVSIGKKYDCAWYASSALGKSKKCPDYGRKYENCGLTAQEACCGCGRVSSVNETAADIDPSIHCTLLP